MATVSVRDPQHPQVKVFAVVDDADLAKVLGKSWRLVHGYAVGNTQHPTRRRHRVGKGFDKKPCSCGMHRFILGLPPGAGGEVDHINGDRLDNRRQNLRVVTRPQNAQNRRKHKPTIHSLQPWTPLRGVHWDSSTKKWKAVCRGRHLGLFSSDVEAGAAVAAHRRTRMPFSEIDQRP